MQLCWKCGDPACFDHGEKELSMKKVITVQIERVVRETWVVGSEATAQALTNGNFEKGMHYVKMGERVVCSEIFSQEVKEVEFYPWDGYEK